MKLAAVLALSLASPSLALAADDPQARLDAKAEACITAGAPEVVKVEPNLSSAVDFLTGDLCAREIEVAQKYAMNRRMLDTMIGTQKETIESAASTRAEATVIDRPPPPGGGAVPVRPAAAVPPMIDWNKKNLATQEEKLAKLEAARIDPQTGEMVGAPKDPTASGMALLQTFLSPLTSSRLSQAPATFRALAARAVLAVREAMR